MIELERQRQDMVAQQIAARGVKQQAVLDAMRRVPREAFVPETLQEFAYQDTPLPIENQQTISQPYIVALMAEALELRQGARVLEVGTGSGYAAAVLAELAAEVYTIERHGDLADRARERLRRAGYDNVTIMHGDGTKGWAEHAPYDAIVVAAGGPEVPKSLLDQLAPGGRLVMPVGPTQHAQELIRITRKPDGGYRSERLTQVRFVPLVGAEGWDERGRAPRARPSPPAELPDHIRQDAEPIDIEDSLQSMNASDISSLLGRIGDARVVCIGEATHGTSEFYRMRERITRALIEEKGFDIVAVEADWPDAGRIDHHVRDLRTPPGEWRAFSRFPTWMWRNQEVREFVDWLRDYNSERAEGERVGFYGLDLYSMYTSIHEVLRYLDDMDPESARVARARYGCLTPWQSDPATYGRAALSGRYGDCESEVVAMLSDLLNKRMGAGMNDGERFMQAVQNARLVVNAERYYRIMYYGSRQSWNLRDSHMFETLKMLLAYRGQQSKAAAKAVVWEHNSHVGDARATAMAARGEHNVGQLVRQEFGQDAYLIGFGTHTGTVAAASDWDQPMEIKTVRPSHERSYERQCHDSGVSAFCLPMRPRNALRERLSAPRLERAIGVIYRPETELASHYFDAVLPRQFDEYIWFDQTRAVTPLDSELLQGTPDTYPFGL